MDDGKLSQEEIDALLKIGEDESSAAVMEDDLAEETEVRVEDYLSSMEADTLGEIGNISFGSSATTLSTLLNETVSITTPEVSIIKKGDLLNAFPFDHVSIKVNYVEGFSGENLFVIKAEDAAIISDIMLGGDGLNPSEELTEIHLSAVQEAMNQMMGAAATSMSTVFMKKVDISPPTIGLVEAESPGEFDVDMDEVFVKVSFQLKVGSLIDSNIMQILPFPFAHELVHELYSKTEETNEPMDMEPNQLQDNGINDEHQETTMTQNMYEQQPQELNMQPETTQNEHAQMIGYTSSPNPNIQPASFTSFEQVNLSNEEQRNLDMLLDIPLKVTVELGRTQRTIKDILELSSGSIVELDKLAGEPVDILVNEKLVAQGEVVVIDENFGVRVTDVISQSARLMNLNRRN